MSKMYLFILYYTLLIRILGLNPGNMPIER
jgi:hypothetical protein